jgi:hypothetical protein
VAKAASAASAVRRSGFGELIVSRLGVMGRRVREERAGAPGKPILPRAVLTSAF